MPTARPDAARAVRPRRRRRGSSGRGAPARIEPAPQRGAGVAAGDARRAPRAGRYSGSGRRAGGRDISCAAATARRPAGRNNASPTTANVQDPVDDEDRLDRDHVGERPEDEHPERHRDGHHDPDEAEHAALPLGLDRLLEERHRRRREERHGEPHEEHDARRTTIRLGARPSAIDEHAERQRRRGDQPDPVPLRTRASRRGRRRATMPTLNAHLEDREVHDVALLAGRERPHEHQRHEVRRRDREHEDDPEQHEQPADERVVARRSGPRRRGRRSSRSPRRHRVRTALTRGSSPAGRCRSPRSRRR